MNEPVRRGRGPNRPKPPAPYEYEITAVETYDSEGVSDEPVDEAPASPVAASRRRRAPALGVASMKLSAPPRPGFVRRFVNDVGNRLAHMMELGYSVVENEAPAHLAPGIRPTALGSQDSRFVGTQKSGEPIKSVLMETPIELYAEGVDEKEAHNRKIDDAIRAGIDSTGRLSRSETYGHSTIKVER